MRAAEGPPTCGRGIAENSALPAAIARLISAMSENLELHLATIVRDSPGSGPEIEAYTGLFRQQRDLGRQLAALAERMEGCRSLPMAEHDPAAFAQLELPEAFSRFVEAERALLAHLQHRLPADEAMLDEWLGQR